MDQICCCLPLSSQQHVWIKCVVYLCSNIECVDLMIGMGCDINSRDKLGRTPLHFAAATAQYQCVLSLVANGASLTCTDKLSRTPLHYAAASDSDAKLVTRLTLQNFAN